jgi:hypothetical protein
MRKVLILVAVVLLAGSALAAVTNASGAWRIPGGPLVYRGGGPDKGLHLSATLPRDQTLYYTAPQLTGSHDPLIEHAELVGVSGGVRVMGLYVRYDGPAAPGTFLTIPESNLRWVLPPARSITFDCCEGSPELLIAFQLDAPGAQSIDAIAVDYRDDPWSYHAVFTLLDTPSLSSR